jgi:hypothetical protein
MLGNGVGSPMLGSRLGSPILGSPMLGRALGRPMLGSGLGIGIGIGIGKGSARTEVGVRPITREAEIVSHAMSPEASHRPRVTLPP